MWIFKQNARTPKLNKQNLFLPMKLTEQNGIKKRVIFYQLKKMPFRSLNQFKESKRTLLKK